MKKSGIPFFFATAIVLAVTACNVGPKITRTDTETSGFAVIGVDECFEPVISEQLAVFMGLNPEATIQPIFVGEKELYELFMSDSIRLIITARDITGSQRDSIRRMRLTPRTQRLAGDGIALIINRSNPDSIMSVSTVRKILTGEMNEWGQLGNGSKLGKIQVVFDKPNSSTVRFMVDSVLRGEGTLSTELRALNGNREVIEHVAQSPNSLGVIGVNWISNMNDTTQLVFNETIRVVALGADQDAVDRGDVFRPYPAYLNNGAYPFRRNVFIIISDSRGGLPSGFVRFAADDAGQRIILKAGLVPATRPTREIMITNQMPNDN